MLRYLSSGKQYKNTELADAMETNVRNIPEYRKELQECGYKFESSSGKYGGIKLKESALIPSPCFSKEEKKALNFVSSFIEGQEVVYCRKDYEKAMGKIFAQMSGSEEGKVSYVKFLDKSTYALSAEELKKRCDFFSECIRKRKVVRLVYRTTIKRSVEEEVEPYELALYHHSWVLWANSRIEKHLKTIELGHIQSYEVTSLGFSRDIFFNERAFEKGEGPAFKDSPIRVKLRLSPLCPYVGDKEFGPNQKEEPQNDGSLILSFDSKNEEEVVPLVLSLEGECEVLEPPSLRDHISKIALQTFKANQAPAQEEKPAPIVKSDRRIDEEQLQTVLSYFQDKEWITVSDIQSQSGTGFPQASRVLKALMEEGYVSPQKGKAGRYAMIKDLKPQRVLNPSPSLKCALEWVKKRGSFTLDEFARELNTHPEKAAKLLDKIQEQKQVIPLFFNGSTYGSIVTTYLGALQEQGKGCLEARALSFCQKEKYITVPKLVSALSISEEMAKRLFRKLLTAQVLTGGSSSRNVVHFQSGKELPLEELPRRILDYCKEQNYLSFGKIKKEFCLSEEKAKSYYDQFIQEGYLFEESTPCLIVSSKFLGFRYAEEETDVPSVLKTRLQESQDQEKQKEQWWNQAVELCKSRSSINVYDLQETLKIPYSDATKLWKALKKKRILLEPRKVNSSIFINQPKEE